MSEVHDTHEDGPPEGEAPAAPTSITDARRTRLKAMRKEQYERAKARAKERAKSPTALALKEQAKERRRAAYDKAKAKAKEKSDEAKSERKTKSRGESDAARAARDAELLGTLTTGDVALVRPKLTLIRGGG